MLFHAETRPKGKELLGRHETSGIQRATFWDRNCSVLPSPLRERCDLHELQLAQQRVPDRIRAPRWPFVGMAAEGRMLPLA